MNVKECVEFAKCCVNNDLDPEDLGKLVKLVERRAKAALNECNGVETNSSIEEQWRIAVEDQVIKMGIGVSFDDIQCNFYKDGFYLHDFPKVTLSGE